MSNPPPEPSEAPYERIGGLLRSLWRKNLAGLSRPFSVDCPATVNRLHHVDVAAFVREGLVKLKLFVSRDDPLLAKSPQTYPDIHSGESARVRPKGRNGRHP